jgi:hypothetical protein
MGPRLREPMPKRKAGPEPESDKPKKKTTLKAWEDVARKAKIVAAIRGLDIFDYIDSILRPAVERDHEQALKQESGDR